MRNKIILILAFIQVGTAYSQQIIDSLKIIPVNPTTADSIYLVTSVTMPTSSNGYLGYELLNSGANLTIEACYKNGMIDGQQTYIDTINLGLKATGTYFLNYIAYTTYFNPCDHSDTFDLQTNFIVTAPLVIDETESEFTFRLFPNPINCASSLEFNLIEDSEVELVIRDSQGRLIKTIISGTLNEGEFQITINMSEVENGIYLVDLDINGIRYIEKLIKQ